MLNSQLLIQPTATEGSSARSMLVTTENSGFEYLTFRSQRLASGEEFTGETRNNELGLVVLGGRCSVQSSAGSWSNFGGRAHVFNGLPHALYLPIETTFTVRAEADCDLALCFCRAELKYPARLVTPHEVEVEIRGG